jgi:hypothetical protein
MRSRPSRPTIRTSRSLGSDRFIVREEVGVSDYYGVGPEPPPGGDASARNKFERPFRLTGWAPLPGDVVAVRSAPNTWPGSKIRSVVRSGFRVCAPRAPESADEEMCFGDRDPTGTERGFNADPRTTLGIYAQATGEGDRKAAEAVAKRFMARRPAQEMPKKPDAP